MEDSSGSADTQLSVVYNSVMPVFDKWDDWRVQLQRDSRQRIINKIMQTLKRHLPFSGQSGLQEIYKISLRFEEKVYISATSQSDYLRCISLKMLTMETKSPHSMANSQPSGDSIAERIPPVQVMQTKASFHLLSFHLNMRCRNMRCQKLLPVAKCSCKFCAQRIGFCRGCMCLFCSKFDKAYGTCSWVSCESCPHKCHVDCAIQQSCIKDGCYATRDEGEAGMQFNCVICGHSSEMFGFVKKVFQVFAKRWTAETVVRELHYVRRIFSPSQDFRGKMLHKIASQMLSNLKNIVYVHEVENHILSFLSVLDRIVEDDRPAHLLLEKCDQVGQSSQKRKFIEPEEVTKACHTVKAKISWTSVSFCSPSETDTSMMLERARNLLRGNAESSKTQFMELEVTMNAIEKDKTGNAKTGISMASSEDTSLLLERARKLLQGNAESRKVQLMEIEETTNASTGDKSGN